MSETLGVAPVATEARVNDIILATANDFSMSEKQLKQALGTIMPREATLGHAAAFLGISREYGLNPFTKQIHCMIGSRQQVIPVVGIDGWATIINKNPKLDGIEFDWTWKDEQQEIPRSCKCSIWRKDRSRPVRIEEFFSECVRNTDPWKNMPRRMLRHKSLIQCSRVAFSYAGIYDEDEAKDIVEAEARVIPPGEQPVPPRDLEAFVQSRRAAGEVRLPTEEEPEQADDKVDAETAKAMEQALEEAETERQSSQDLSDGDLFGEEQDVTEH